MVETFLFAMLFAGCSIFFKLGRFSINKDSYSIKPLFKRWSVYPIVIMALFYIILQCMVLNQNYFFLPYQKIIKNLILLSYMILMFDVLFKYEKYKEIIIACSCLLGGSILNFIAIHFNNGKMPIYPSISYATGYTQPDMILNIHTYGDFHVLGDHTTNLIWLCDIFDMFGLSIWSVGDILIRCFAFIIIYYSVKESNRRLKFK